MLFAEWYMDMHQCNQPNQNKPQVQHDLLSFHPQLAELVDASWLDVLDVADEIKVGPNITLLMQNAPCKDFLLLLEGSIRIFQVAEDGREVTLYRIEPGDTCVMGLNSFLHEKPFAANAITETEIKALRLSLPDFRKAMGVSESFRNHVLGGLTSRFCDMIVSLQDTVFQRLDMRLACLLGRLFERADSDTIKITHMELANELGTTREVISRILKQLEQQGCINLARGQIQVASNQNLEWFRML